MFILNLLTVIEVGFNVVYCLIGAHLKRPWFDSECKELKAKGVCSQSWMVNALNSGLRARYFNINREYKWLIGRKKQLAAQYEEQQLYIFHILS